MTGLTERPVWFPCEADTLLGVLSEPAGPVGGLGDLGVVIVVGGPQYRVGSHRQFVALARRLAEAGHPVLRFDVRGMGDSTGEQRRFDTLSADIGAAVDALAEEVPAVRRVVLWGLCDGAAAALIYVDELRDSRIAAVVALNPWVRSDASQEQTQVRHYYTERLRSPEFWRKLLRGGVGLAALREFAGKLARVAKKRLGPAREARETGGTYQERMARACEHLGASVHVILSEHDFTAKEFIDSVAGDPAWIRAREGLRARWEIVTGADHTFSDPLAARAAEDSTLRLLQSRRTTAMG